MESFKQILKRKQDYYGKTEASYEFAAEEYIRLKLIEENIVEKKPQDFLYYENGLKKVNLNNLSFIDSLDLLNGHGLLKPNERMQSLINEMHVEKPPSLVLERTSKFKETNNEKRN